MGVRENFKRVTTVAVDSVVGLIALALVGAIGSALAIYWATGPLSTLSRPAAYVGGALVFAAIAMSYRSIVEYHDRSVRRRRAHLSPDELETQLVEWLYRNSFSVKKEKRATDDFRIVADNELKVPVTIIKPVNGRWVVLATRIEVSPHQRELADTVAARLRHDVTVALNQIGVQFHQDLQGNQLHGIDLSHLVLFDESMGELQFFREIYLVRRAAFVVISLVQRETDTKGPPPKPIPPPDSPPPATL